MSNHQQSAQVPLLKSSTSLQGRSTLQLLLHSVAGRWLMWSKNPYFWTTRFGGNSNSVKVFHGQIFCVSYSIHIFFNEYLCYYKLHIMLPQSSTLIVFDLYLNCCCCWFFHENSISRRPGNQIHGLKQKCQGKSSLSFQVLWDRSRRCHTKRKKSIQNCTEKVNCIHVIIKRRGGNTSVVSVQFFIASIDFWPLGGHRKKKL